MLFKIVGIVLFIICVWQSSLLFDNYTTTKDANYDIMAKICKPTNTMVYAQEHISETMRVHPSVDSMRSNRDLKDGLAVQTLGYYKVNDGGAALYSIRSRKSSDIEDGGSLIFLANGNVAELITDGKVNIKQFGAVGDGVKDDTKAIKKAISFGTSIEFPKGHFVINETLELDRKTLKGCSRPWGNEAVIVSKQDIAIHLNGYNYLNDITISRKEFPNQDSATRGIWIEGGFNRLNNVNIYNHAVGIYMSNDSKGCVYNHIVDGVIANCFEGIYLLSQGKGWVNENTFENINIRHTGGFHKYIDTLPNAMLIKDRFAVTMTYSNDATNGINMNKFLCMNLEGCYNGFSVSASSCIFLSNRTEGNKIGYYFKDHQSIDDNGSVGKRFKTGSNIIINGVVRNIKQDGDVNREPKMYTTVTGTKIIPVKNANIK